MRMANGVKYTHESLLLLQYYFSVLFCSIIDDQMCEKTTHATKSNSFVQPLMNGKFPCTDRDKFAF